MGAGEASTMAERRRATMTVEAIFEGSLDRIPQKGKDIMKVETKKKSRRED
jgi:hypothetical protein